MGFHTFDVSNADRLEDESRYRVLSRDELVGHLDDPDGRVADLGSGTGFYTDDVAPRVDVLYAADVQAEMHAQYRRKGLPENVVPVTVDLGALPFADGVLDAAFSTMTFHEFADVGALSDLYRALAPGARVVVADWSAGGEGERGPPLEERFDAEEATHRLREAGFSVTFAQERPETFLVVAVAN